MKWDEFLELLKKNGHSCQLVFHVSNFQNEWFRDEIKQTDIIWGKGVRDQNTCLLYGREKLQHIIDTGKSEAVKECILELDYDTEELEYACAAIEVLKGSCDYPSDEDMEVESTV
jgi:hypothetical protein